MNHPKALKQRQLIQKKVKEEQQQINQNNNLMQNCKVLQPYRHIGHDRPPWHESKTMGFQNGAKIDDIQFNQQLWQNWINEQDKQLQLQHKKEYQKAFYINNKKVN